ncbi:hypothetical protein RND71_006367 [Anisodus tanguticus]|uniref:Argonaute linker 1 domain-containing protein n=1 Tax=Anisodus tanguticus TaxID=243964 RepID=A0AAE1ST82_9SOLA|nr:hypothetical protein RND71_006367 [Anisodus tanguticus]
MVDSLKVPIDFHPAKAEPDPVKKKALRVPIARRGLGSKGQKIPILTNHFKVNVALFYEDGRPVEGKGIGRKVLDRVHETYDTELAGKDFAYDGEKSLNGSPNEIDRKRLRRPYHSKTYKVEISFSAKIPMQAIANALRGQESENSQEALRVLDIILRQHAAKQQVRNNDYSNIRGCLLVRQSFFHYDSKNFADVGGGVLGCGGFHSSFRTTQSGLSLNNEEQIENSEVQTSEVTIYDYFVNHRNIDLRYSADFPCINVGKPKRPTYFQLCTLVSLQRYTKALSTFQRASLAEKSRQKPHERMQILSNALKINNYDAEPLLRSSGVSISSNFTQIEGRVLPAPKSIPRSINLRDLLVDLCNLIHKSCSRQWRLSSQECWSYSSQHQHYCLPFSKV